MTKTAPYLPYHSSHSRILAAFSRFNSHPLRCWNYRLKTGKQQRSQPVLSLGDRYIVQMLQRHGGFQTSLEALNLPSNPAFFPAALELTQQLPRPAAPLTPGAIESQAEISGEVCRDRLGHCVHGDAFQIVRDYPEVLLWGLEERLLDLVEAYIQMPIAYLGVNLRRDIPNAQQVGTRLWHLDGEDTRVVKVMVYLSDVERQHGPFEYIPKSQFNSTYRYFTPNYLRHQKLHCYDADMAKIVPPEHWQNCVGPAGSIIIADTTQVFHHGAVPTAERTALIFAYTTREPKKLDFCKEYFPAEELLPSLKTRLSPRQWDCLWGWRQQPESKLASPEAAFSL